MKKCENQKKHETKKYNSKCANKIKEADKNYQDQYKVSKPKDINVYLFMIGSEVQNNFLEGKMKYQIKSNVIYAIIRLRNLLI